MSPPVERRESGLRKVIMAESSSSQLDYAKVQAYWKQAAPSILGPYMMDGLGFPAYAGRFRFRQEQKAVAGLLRGRGLASSCSVLDIGSGVGFWSEYFARSFAKVVSVESSPSLYGALKDRCSRYPNVKTYNDDALSLKLQDNFGLVFLGGLLMYLNEHDIRTLMEQIVAHLAPGALVICRESTIRRGTKTLKGEYQVVYRSVETYRSIFADAGFDVVHAQPNAAYICPQMSCELVKKWKAMFPQRCRWLPIVGQLAYWGLRIGYPWNTRVIPWLMALSGREFPFLTNHFFALEPCCCAQVSRSKT
jgi:SAM-dependent methyltransferase